MKIHFIAIGGSAMHNLAIALHNKGFRVTGSDDVLFEPSKSRLAKYGILPGQEGWYPEKITADLDAVILGMHARIDNPELLRAQQLGLKIYSYPEYVYQQAKDKLRVVIGGSHGKTTITSIILHVLQAAGKDFDYLVGAQLAGFETMVKLTHQAPLMVIEGDEYLSSPIDRRPKFHLYQANIGVISGIAWDHINVFPTFDSYVEQFRIFVDTIRPQGSLIWCEKDEVLQEVVARNQRTDISIIGYQLPQYRIQNGVTSIVYEQKEYPLLVFGEHNLLNIEAARHVCTKLDIAAADFYEAVTTFKGAARRLELLAKNERVSVYKDFAHSPSKLRATIHAVKAQFPNRKLVACIELHTFSSLNKDFLNEYAGTMDEADCPVVFIDQKTFAQKKIEPYTGEHVQDAFANKNLRFYNDAPSLLLYLKNLGWQDKNLLMMSSGNFGGIDLNALSVEITAQIEY